MHDHQAHQKKLARVAVRVMPYVSGLSSTVSLWRSCSRTAYATIGHAVKIMLNVLIIIVVKIGTDENPARRSKRANSMVMPSMLCWACRLVEINIQVGI